MYRDSSGKTLEDYPRPSVAVDTAVLTVGPRQSFDVLLVRRDSAHRHDVWALPGSFLHQGERLADAVRRSLEQKAGLTETRPPRQLRVFDDPQRDDRGWVLSVAHVVVLPWRILAPVAEARHNDVAFRRVEEAAGLPFDHDEIVIRAVEEVRAGYRERPDPEGLMATEEFTLRELRDLHDAIAERPWMPDAFRRRMADQLRPTGRRSEGKVGKPAALFVNPHLT